MSFWCFTSKPKHCPYKCDSLSFTLNLADSALTVCGLDSISKYFQKKYPHKFIGHCKSNCSVVLSGNLNSTSVPGVIIPFTFPSTTANCARTLLTNIPASVTSCETFVAGASFSNVTATVTCGSYSDSIPIPTSGLMLLCNGSLPVVPHAVFTGADSIDITFAATGDTVPIGGSAFTQIFSSGTVITPCTESGSAGLKFSQAGTYQVTLIGSFQNPTGSGITTTAGDVGVQFSTTGAGTCTKPIPSIFVGAIAEDGSLPFTVTGYVEVATPGSCVVPEFSYIEETIDGVNIVGVRAVADKISARPDSCALPA